MGPRRLRSMLGRPLLVTSTCLQKDLGNTRSFELCHLITASDQKSSSCRDQPRVRKERAKARPGQTAERCVDRQCGRLSPRKLFPVTPVKVLANSEGSLLSQALLNRIPKKGPTPTEAVERTSILVQTFLSMTAPNSSDPSPPIIWKA